MMPAHAAAAGYTPPREDGVGAASFCIDFSSDEHGIDVLFCEATSGRRTPTGCPRDLSRFVRVAVMVTL
jgi:hypothetical protein